MSLSKAYNDFSCSSIIEGTNAKDVLGFLEKVNNYVNYDNKPLVLSSILKQHNINNMLYDLEKHYDNNKDRKIDVSIDDVKSDYKRYKSMKEEQKKIDEEYAKQMQEQFERDAEYATQLYEGDMNQMFYDQEDIKGDGYVREPIPAYEDQLMNGDLKNMDIFDVLMPMIFTTTMLFDDEGMLNSKILTPLKPKSFESLETHKFSDLKKGCSNICTICSVECKEHDLVILCSCKHIYHKDCLIEPYCKICKISTKDIKEQKLSDIKNEFKNSCNICSVKYKESDTVILFSCKHIYHKTCLKDSKLCRICKVEMKDSKEHKYSDVKDSPTCSICITDYEDVDILKITPCGHAFHQECLAEWIKDHHTCPLCREILGAYDYSDNGQIIGDSISGIRQNLPGRNGINPLVSLLLRGQEVALRRF